MELTESDRQALEWDFWSNLLKNKGFEYITPNLHGIFANRVIRQKIPADIMNKYFWGWKFYQLNDFVVGFLHKGQFTFGCSDPHFKLYYKGEETADWSFNVVEDLGIIHLLKEFQDMILVLDAIREPKLWPMCMGIPWAQSIMEKILK